MVERGRHRTVLYTLVVLLAIVQMTSFVAVSVQVSKINTALDTETKELRQENIDLENSLTSLIETYDALYQENFQEITGIITMQQEDFEQDKKILNKK